MLFWADAVASLNHETRELLVTASGRAGPHESPCTAWAEKRFEEFVDRLDPTRLFQEGTFSPPSQTMPKHSESPDPVKLPASAPFEKAVALGKSAIGRGDVFQINLAQRFELGEIADPWKTYRMLREKNPAPFAGFLRFQDLELLSASPELLVRSVGRRVETHPIAGTHPRGESREHDDAICAALKAHPKERAEHIMLVDLSRNDLGRVSEYGSVQVEELLGIQSFATVHHLVSIVAGRLKPEVTPYEILAALFPGGTITGAPKIRATELIREFEPRARGPYTGSLGFLDLSGNQTWNISIRTLVLKGKKASLHAGAGIVWDSIPEREFRESVQKAKAFLEMLGVSTQGADLTQ